VQIVSLAWLIRNEAEKSIEAHAELPAMKERQWV
jgi:hypothetical protein